MADDADLAVLLAAGQEDQVETEGTIAEPAAEIYRRYRLTNLAEQVEEAFGPTLLTREELLDDLKKTFSENHKLVAMRLAGRVVS